jgi:hypothetical protein
MIEADLDLLGVEMGHTIDAKYHVSMAKLKEASKGYRDTVREMDPAEIDSMRLLYGEGVLAGLKMSKELIKGVKND